MSEPSRGATTPKPSPLDFLPARWIPLLYLGFAHLALAVAFGVVAADPVGIGGFYYHPRLVAVVHLVTIGWISGAILGSLYLVAPLAFRTALPAGRADYAAFASFAIGLVGMAAHFWIDAITGVAWAAGMVLAALAFVGLRVVRGLARAPVPGEARLPVALAIVNVLATAVVGMMLAVNKAHPYLPWSQLQSVLAHAHLAVVGWAVLMVMGAGYRLLPMILPAAMPRGRWPVVATLLTQAGAWGLLVGFLLGGPWLPAFACVAAAGIAVFLSQVAWMARHRRPAPAEMRRPDPGVLHAAQAVGSLAVSTVIGVALAFAPSSEASLRWAMAYGTVALVGVFGHMVTGVAGRIVPLYAWLWGFADREHKESPPSLHRAPSRAIQLVVLVLWTAGLPALAIGLALESPVLVRASAAGLSSGVVLAAANHALVLTRLWRRGVART